MAVIRFPPNQHFVMKPHVIKFAEGMESHFGGAMNWGTYAGHSPPEGPTQALDHFNPNSSSGHRQQDVAAEWAIKNAKKYGLRYIIKRYEIWNIERATEGWRKRSATGNATADHLDHNHYTFYASAPISEVDEPENDEENEMVYYGDSPDEREYAFWMVFGIFKKKLHTSVIWDEARELAKLMDKPAPKHVGKIPLATFDALIDVETIIKGQDK